MVCWMTNGNIIESKTLSLISDKGGDEIQYINIDA